MKKTGLVFFCLILLLGLVACGNVNQNNRDEEETHKEALDDEVNFQGPITLRGATFYPPLTRAEAEERGIGYDGLLAINGVEFVTYDWVVGDDGMDDEEEFSDSDMTADTYAEALGGHVATEAELVYLMSREPVLDPEYGFGWPSVYWVGDWWGERESGEESNPCFYDLNWYWEENSAAYDFVPFNMPVIVVVGEMYEADYTGAMEIREKEFAEDGSGYFVNTLWDKERETEELMIIYTNEKTLVYNENGEEIGVEGLVSSQLEFEIIMDDSGEFAKKIYILPFSM